MSESRFIFNSREIGLLRSGLLHMKSNLKQDQAEQFANDEDSKQVFQEIEDLYSKMHRGEVLDITTREGWNSLEGSERK